MITASSYNLTQDGVTITEPSVWDVSYAAPFDTRDVTSTLSLSADDCTQPNCITWSTIPIYY